MTCNEFKRWLRAQGVQIGAGKGSHRSLRLGLRRSVLPDHGAKEIGTGLVAKIKRDLGLK